VFTTTVKLDFVTEPCCPMKFLPMLRQEKKQQRYQYISTLKRRSNSHQAVNPLVRKDRKTPEEIIE